MTTTILTSLLVGAYHRPPAKQILAHLPSGCPLVLDPDPQNPHDTSAIAVLVEPEQISEAEHEQLSGELLMIGRELDEILFGGFVQLGFVAANDGKPLRQSLLPGLVGNQQFLAALAAGPEGRAELAFGPEGEPLVRLVLPAGEG